MNFFFSSSRNCLPYFKRAQRHELANGASDPWRGHDGPLHVSRGRCEHPLHKAFLEAGEQAGLGRTDDPNGLHQDGVGPADLTIWDGVRCSASTAYLKPVRLLIPKKTMIKYD